MVQLETQTLLNIKLSYQGVKLRHKELFGKYFFALLMMTWTSVPNLTLSYFSTCISEEEGGGSLIEDDWSVTGQISHGKYVVLPLEVNFADKLVKVDLHVLPAISLSSLLVLSRVRLTPGPPWQQIKGIVLKACKFP